jgi:hypothetical protein
MSSTPFVHRTEGRNPPKMLLTFNLKERKMKTKLMVCLIFLISGWAFLAVNGNSAELKHKPYKVRNSSLPPAAENYVPPGPPSKYPVGGLKYSANCLSIAPEIGWVIEHNQIGTTWYDFQQNGSMGRMISVTSGGYRHVSWMYTNCAYTTGCPRYVKGNCEAPASTNNWPTAANVDGGTNINAGYSNQTHLSDGTGLVIYHRTAGSPIWYSAIAVDDSVCSGYWSRRYDIPDGLPEATSSYKYIEWPKCEVKHDTLTGRDYIHVVGTEGNTAGGVPVMVGYERCWIKDSTGLTDPMYCQCYRDGATQTYRMLPGVAGGGINYAFVSHFDSSCSITPVVVVSPVSERIAIAFLKPADPAGSCDYFDDVCYIESMVNGDDWIAGSPWPPPEYNITHYGLSSGERAYEDLSACYDYQDSLHIIWSAPKFDSVDQSIYMGQVKLKHWSKKSGISIIASQNQEAPYYISGAHNAFIAKPSISAPDPVYYEERDTILCVIWTQFDSSDVSANGYGNGDIYMTLSCNGGLSWGGKYNVTNTQTPNCAAGNCLSEHWSSMAQNVYDGDLHIQYVCDKDAGGAIQDSPSAWMENPVMYLRMGIDYDCHPGICWITCVTDSPRVSWNSPPLKVAPGGSRNLILKMYDVGNDVCNYSVVSDNSCIQINVSGTLSPRDSIILIPVISGVGVCNNSYFGGNITITTDDPDYPQHIILPIRVIVADDYYECPRDPLTNDTLDNGILQMYLNANGQEWIHDQGSFPDTVHDVFFNGGLFAATTQSSDTLVGRYYGGGYDKHALAREQLYLNSMYNDFWLEYSWDVCMHDLNPPVDTKWWWFEMLHENVFFKPNASDALRHCVIKFVTAEIHDPPVWWPSQPAFTGCEDTYLGIMMDIDCPYDTFRGQYGRNRAGYDAANNIAYQRGWDFTGAHSSYNDYYAGIALAQGTQPGESTVPWGTYNLRNDVYLYPQSPWGWKDGDFYRLASGNVPGDIQEPDSIVDRSQILTARKITADTTRNRRVSFTVIEAIGTAGLADLQAKVAAARTWMTSQPFILCADVNNSGVVDAGDIVYLIEYLYRNGPEPVGPKARGDVNHGGVIEAGDIVLLISYLYRSGPPPKCPGVW